VDLLTGAETPIRTYNLSLLGFGNVNRALIRLLRAKHRELADSGIAWRITGVASRSLGWLANPDGIPAEALTPGTDTAALAAGATPSPNMQSWLKAARADILFEATSLNPHTGQPAIQHVRAGLEAGAHVITANKGPIVHAYEELADLARRQGKRFLFEATVMDGVPIFSLFREELRAVRLHGFHGVLNSTTNVILSGMEEGMSFEQSLLKAKHIGVAETDPTNDIEGWDATVKVAALIRVLMGAPIRLEEIERQGIGHLNLDAVRSARKQGKPYKLVCRARRVDSGIVASVRPEQVPLSDPLAWVNGTSSIVCFETDVFPGLAITENHPGLDATAYGMFSDFLTVAGRA